MGLLEQTLSDVGHDLFVLSNLGGDSDQGAELGRQVDVLSFLTDFEKRLTHAVDFNIVGRVKIVNHVGSGLLVAVVEDVVLGVHVPLNRVDLVGSVGPVLGHDDRALELSVDKALVVSLEPVLDKR